MPDKNVLLAVDAVVFTVFGNDLKILLIKRKKEPFRGKYALPGGFVEEKENFADAAERELYEETGVKDVFLKQLNAFGNVGRDPRARVISIPFLAIISSENRKLKPFPEHDAADAGWFSIYKLPELAFDHKDIIDYAIKRLRFEVQTTNIAYQLLPKQFTLTELQKAYEAILDIKLDKRNFRKKIFWLGIIKPTNDTKMEGAHRPAQLFSFKDKEYKPVREKIHVFL